MAKRERRVHLFMAGCVITQRNEEEAERMNIAQVPVLPRIVGRKGCGCKG